MRRKSRDGLPVEVSAPALLRARPTGVPLSKRSGVLFSFTVREWEAAERRGRRHRLFVRRRQRRSPGRPSPSFFHAITEPYGAAPGVSVWVDYAPRHCPKTIATSKVSMLTKITIISCETCGRIVTRSRIDGFPSSLADAVTSLARAAMIGGPRCPDM